MTEASGEELPPEVHGDVVCDADVAVHARANESERLFHHVVRGEHEVRELTTAEGGQHFPYSLVTGVLLTEQGEDKAGVEEDHRFFGAP